MSNLQDFLNLNSIYYYPNINYIPFELAFHNLNIDWNMNMLNDNNNKNDINNDINNNVDNKEINVKNQNIKWKILINFKNINNDFFKQVRNLNLNNVILPQNCICVIYYNDKENIKKCFWSNHDNELLYGKFIK